jgi:hypothetical protein
MSTLILHGNLYYFSMGNMETTKCADLHRNSGLIRVLGKGFAHRLKPLSQCFCLAKESSVKFLFLDFLT